MSRNTTTSRLGRALALGLAAALIGGASLFGATAAQAAPGDVSSVSGIVKDGTAAPLGGVAASLRIPGVGGDSDTVLSGTTAGDGSFTLAGVPDGTYTIEFSLAGYGDESVPVTVAGVDVTDANATMLQELTGTASISGTPVLGNVLTAVPAGWPVGTAFTYDWGYSFGQGGDTLNVTTATYTVSDTVIGRWVSVRVTGTLAGYASTTVLTTLDTAASAPKKATGAAPADTTGSTPDAQTSAGLPAGPLDPGVDHNANVNWAGADSYVDVYVFSTPTLVGTFPVVNGVAQITLSKAVLAKLSTGTHTLVITGQTSGAVQSVTLALGLAVTGADDPTVPVTVASLLLLLGAGLLIGRRRLAQKA